MDATVPVSIEAVEETTVFAECQRAVSERLGGGGAADAAEGGMYGKGALPVDTSREPKRHAIVEQPGEEGGGDEVRRERDA